MVLEHTRQREDVTYIIIDDEYMLTGEYGIGVMQPLEHSPLLLRELRLHAVQEQRGLVEQALRTLHVLDDDRIGEAPEPRLLVLRQLLSGIDDDRQIAHRRVALHRLEQLEP